jgi:hypothetical protein
MNTIIGWNELEDDLEQETEIVTITYNDKKNMLGEPISFIYSNAMCNGKQIAVVCDNENDGSSATPAEFTEGHHTIAEFILSHLQLTMQR